MGQLDSESQKKQKVQKEHVSLHLNTRDLSLVRSIMSLQKTA